MVIGKCPNLCGHYYYSRFRGVGGSESRSGIHSAPAMIHFVDVGLGGTRYPQISDRLCPTTSSGLAISPVAHGEDPNGAIQVSCYDAMPRWEVLNDPRVHLSNLSRLTNSEGPIVGPKQEPNVGPSL